MKTLRSNKRENAYDPHSRYSDINQTIFVFMTPKQVEELDIGYDLREYNVDEQDDLFPFLYDVLVQRAVETYVGAENGSVTYIPVESDEWSNVNVYPCIEINGKLCKLQNEEHENGFVSKLNQVKLYQRLLSDGEVTMDDLTAADIDIDIYKKLMINEISGVVTCVDKIKEIRKILLEQSEDDVMQKRKRSVLKNLGWDLDSDEYKEQQWGENKLLDEIRGEVNLDKVIAIGDRFHREQEERKQKSKKTGTK